MGYTLSEFILKLIEFHKIERNNNTYIKKLVFHTLMYDEDKYVYYDIFKELRFFFIKSEYIVKYLHWYIDNDGSSPRLRIIMEKGEKVDLIQLFKYDLDEKLKILIRMCYCIKYLHDNNMVHLDLKPKNFIKINDKYKLIDFGLTLSKNNKLNKIISVNGTLDYSNYVLNKNYKFDKDNLLMHDIYSLGNIIWVIVFNKEHPISKDRKSFSSIIQKRKKNIMIAIRDKPQCSFIRNNGSFSNENMKTLINNNDTNGNNSSCSSNSRHNNNQYKLISDLIISCIGDIEGRPTIDGVIERLYYIINIRRNNENKIINNVKVLFGNE